MARGASKNQPARRAQAKPNGKAAAAKVAAKAKAPAKAEAPPAATIEQVRQRMHAEIGQIVLAMMKAPRYRHHSIAELQALLLDPMAKDRVAIARVHEASGAETVIGIAIWASVSAEVDAKIEEQVRAGVLPVRLNAEDWASGDKLWLIDLIAPTRKTATAVLVNFRQVAGSRAVKIHPLIARSVDGKVLERLRMKAS
ncbi:MAG: toxin-activating lysine-acyltransferase [Sphingorhabdus sp.]